MVLLGICHSYIHHVLGIEVDSVRIDLCLPSEKLECLKGIIKAVKAVGSEIWNRSLGTLAMPVKRSDQLGTFCGE